MQSKLIIDGNSVYEIDEECMRHENRDKKNRPADPSGEETRKKKEGGR